MRYLIDTTLVIDTLLGIPDAVARLETLATDGIAVSIVTYMEAYQGTLRGQATTDDREVFTTFFASAPVLPFSQAVARRCAGIRQGLKQRGRRVNSRAFDLVIAATAIEYGLELVTSNVADYADIPGIMLYTP